MKYLTALFLMLGSAYLFAEHNHSEKNHSEKNHVETGAVDGEQLEISSELLDKFSKGLSDSRIAVVSVKGMVCDFCARGLEKTFRKDKSVQKIDVLLEIGKVLIAYDSAHKVNKKDIKKKISRNGFNTTSVEFIEI